MNCTAKKCIFGPEKTELTGNMQRIRAVVEYDGSAYNGWQYQENAKSVQAAIEQALQVVFKEKIGIVASGRTDSGVHARNQVFHADIPVIDLKRLLNSLNGLLEKDIVIKQIDYYPGDFHARFDAIRRKYRYYISEVPTALNRNYSWTIHFPVNITLMQAGASQICEYDDFKTFCKTGSEVKTYRCRIYESRWLREKDMLIYEIEANRFLYGMVRAITGMMIDIGRGKMTLQDLHDIFLARDRTLVLNTAPARGLVLENVYY